MQIPSYQINNILKVYTRQLSQSKLINRQKEFAQERATDSTELSSEGKRQAVIEQVSAEIINRITHFGPQDESEEDIIKQLKNEIGKEIEIIPKGGSNFIYNTLDENNEKVTQTLSVEDSNFLIKRLEELVKVAVDKNMES
ncbi:MAG: hypothetical protein K9L30_02095 [Desulfobacterales bacterium]|nr:hypothetical protein [Desulfobacterales bacterium]